jgi:glycosyltransferase involved in cell wall biosynthesis
MSPLTHVCLAIPSLDLGGPEKTYFELLVRLDRSRFSVTLLVEKLGGHYFGQLPADVRIEVLPPPSRGISKARFLDFAKSLRRIRPDVCIATHRMQGFAVMAKALMHPKTKLILRQDNLMSGNIAAAQRTGTRTLSTGLKIRLYRKTDAVIGLTPDVCADLAKYVPPYVPMIAIGNSIDVAETRRMALQPCGLVLRGSPKLISVGRLHWQKGHDILLKAFATLVKDFPKATLTIVGEGPDENELRALSHTLGIQKSVNFTGRFENPFALLHRADLFVLATRYEGFGHVFLEALACGLPVVTTSCPGSIANEIVIDGSTGVLVPVEDPRALSLAISRTLSRLPSDIRPGFAARAAQIVSRFAPSEIVDQYQTLMLSLVDPQAVSSGR